MKIIKIFFKITGLIIMVFVGFAFARLYKKSKKYINTDNSFKKSSKNQNLLNDRQKKLLELVKNKKEIYMNSVMKFFPEITNRTLRRDFNKLSDLGLVKKFGKTKSAKYLFVS